MSLWRWVCLLVLTGWFMIGVSEKPIQAGGFGCWGFGRPVWGYRGGPVRNVVWRVHNRWQAWRWGYGGFGYPCRTFNPCFATYYADPIWYGDPCWSGHWGAVDFPSRAIYANANLTVDSWGLATRQPLYREFPNEAAWQHYSVQPGNALQPQNTPSSAVRGDEVLLDLAVPPDAVVTINGHPTESRGGSRQYIARRLNPVRDYSFEIKAVILRDGQEWAHSTTLSTRSGQRQQVSMDEVAFSPVPSTTTLIVHLPADARLKIAGSDTTQTGSERVFVTSALRPGESWSDYHLVAEVERDGQIVREERVVELRGGQTHEIALELQPMATRVASR
ncbi:MAG TPA: TIGR03000 domain-containing protein [Pirellulaceae bacterium]|nr:TIGR03000 domain-containing protein [Pirellulaceae bacterium]